MTEKADILFYVEDPGAANYLADIPAALAARGVESCMAALGFARSFLAERGVKSDAGAGSAQPGELLDSVSPAVVVVGTTENLETRSFDLVAAARARGIPTVGAVDAYANASYRFRGKSADPLAHAPEWLLVPDAETKRAFQDLGHGGGKIRVCGHPQYDRVREAAARFAERGRASLRKSLMPGCGAGQRAVVFLSELSTGLCPEQFRRSPAYTLKGRGERDGRTEIVLEEFLDALAESSKPVYRVLRLHPKNTRAELVPYLKEFDLVSDSGSPLELVYAADLVVGMTTNLMLEAALLGRPTLSIVPREEERAWLPTIAAGVTPCAVTRVEIRAALARALERPEGALTDVIERLMPAGCVGRVADFLCELVAERTSGGRRP